MRSLLTLAYKLLVNDRAKFAALTVGLTFSVFLMVQMTSMFSGILQRASATVVNTGAVLWVMDPAVTTVANSSATSADARSVSRIPLRCSRRSVAAGGMQRTQSFASDTHRRSRKSGTV